MIDKRPLLNKLVMHKRRSVTTRTVTLRLPESLIAKLDCVAGKFNMSRNLAANILLSEALDQASPEDKA